MVFINIDVTADNFLQLLAIHNGSDKLRFMEECFIKNFDFKTVDSFKTLEILMQSEATYDYDADLIANAFVQCFESLFDKELSIKQKKKTSVIDHIDHILVLNHCVHNHLHPSEIKYWSKLKQSLITAISDIVDEMS